MSDQVYSSASDPLFEELQQAAEAALHATSLEDGVRELAKAISLFSKETSRLKNAYQSLQDRFYAVNCELAKKNQILEEKNRELEGMGHYLDKILQNISEGILFIDLRGTITICNKEAGKILKKEPQKILFKRFWNHFPDDFFGFSLKDALNFGLTKRLHHLSLPEERREVELVANFVFEEPKLYQGISIVLRDTTEFQRLNDIANRNDRMKELGEMAATVAHEIRNPLGGIRGYASLLFRDLSPYPSLQQMAEQIISGTRSLEQLVNSILHYTRPLQLKVEFIDLGELLTVLKKSIEVDTSFSKEVAISLHLPESRFLVPVDKELIQRSLLNLIVNAYQALDGPGQIEISLVRQGQYGCLVTVSDTGKGILAADLKHIFSPFFTTKQKGTGLGLSETYKIIQAHFGSIEVRSEVGKGSCFSIFLPLKKVK